MEQNILVSVIVPVYNVENYLGRCVDSILAQSYRNLEIILVDDGAKDSSGRICDEYAAKDCRIRVIHKKNGGLSSARNAGIDVALGEYLSFVDSDDWIEQDAIENLLQTAQEFQTELVIGGRWDVKEKSGEKKKGLCPKKREVLSSEETIRRMFTWNQCDSAAWDKLYHRRLFREIRFPQGKVCEDVPIMYRIVLDARQVAFLDKPVYFYYHRPGSITYTSVSEKNFHFSEHTEKILPYIRENFPELRNEAEYLRVRSLVYAVMSVELASDADREKFREKCRTERMKLRTHLPFVLSSPLFGRKERITDILLAFGLYRSLRKVFSKEKR